MSDGADLQRDFLRRLPARSLLPGRRLVRWLFRRIRGLVSRLAAPAPVATVRSLVAVTLVSAAFQPGLLARPDPKRARARSLCRRSRFLPTALIVPYDVKSKTGIQDADHLLVSYDRYVELWNRAYPDKKIEAHPAPLPYALSGGGLSRRRWKARIRSTSPARCRSTS